MSRGDDPDSSDSSIEAISLLDTSGFPCSSTTGELTGGSTEIGLSVPASITTNLSLRDERLSL